MANFWGNSSSQYIAKKIIRLDFSAIPRPRRDLPVSSFRFDFGLKDARGIFW